MPVSSNQWREIGHSTLCRIRLWNFRLSAFLADFLDRVQFRLKLGDPCELQILIMPQVGDLGGHLIDQHAEAFVRAPDASPLSRGGRGGGSDFGH